MKNLDQLRAGNALRASREHKNEFTGEDGGEAPKKIPMEIRTNGLLGSMTFALEKNGRRAIYEKAILPHLRQRWEDVPVDLEEAVKWLCSRNANTLRIITAETLAYLNYFRRLAKKR